MDNLAEIKSPEIRKDREQKLSSEAWTQRSSDNFALQTVGKAVPKDFGSGSLELFDSSKLAKNGSDNGKTQESKNESLKTGPKEQISSSSDQKKTAFDSQQPGDKLQFKPEGRVVKIENSWQLDNLQIEKGMTVMLVPGMQYKIHHALKLPDGASIIGDKNNPPSIDYVGKLDEVRMKNGKKELHHLWPHIIEPKGDNNVIDGVKVECSKSNMDVKGGAIGIFAGEGVKNLKIQNCSSGKIDSFISLIGADHTSIENCHSPVVGSYFLWNDQLSKNTTLKDSSCGDSRREWTVRSYGDNFRVEHCALINLSRGNVVKGALALYKGNAELVDSFISGGMRVGPQHGDVHGAQYVDPKHIDRLKPNLSPQQRQAAETLRDQMSLHASGNYIEGGLCLNQNAKDVVFENNDIYRASAKNGSYIVFTEYRKIYSGFRDKAEAIFKNNRFGGPVDKILNNPSHSPVTIGEGNTFNGKAVRPKG
ncbi:MAG: hypothetical protein K2X27_18405 [Candidatus Obscuribacterales bacterium]|nr:hypothetical protein [Candidatus Obscuribacterales bacterium]